MLSDGSPESAAGAEVIIWEPESCSLLHVLTPPTWDETLDPSSTQIITGLSFIADEPLLWIEPGPSPSGMRNEGHWSYAVAWDGELGLTIRYAEYLLEPERVAGGG